MKLMALGAICAMALAPCAAMHARYGARATRTLPISLCAQSLILYSFGIFLPFSCCCALLCAICVFCVGYALVRAGGVRKALGFWDVAATLFVLGVLLIAYACRGRRLLSYDEYSHWGLMIRLIHHFDALPRAGAGAALVLYDYPPIGAMIPAACAQLLGDGDAVMYLGYMVLLWGLLLGLTPTRGGVIFRMAGAAALFLCLTALFPFALLRLFSEPLIALLFALLTVRAFEGEKTRAALAVTAAEVACLALTKNTGLLWIGLYLLVRVWMRPHRQEIGRSALLLACAAAAFFSYMLYARMQGFGSAFSAQTATNVRDWLGGGLNALRAACLRAF